MEFFLNLRREIPVYLRAAFCEKQGQELETTLAERMIGIDMEDLKKCPETICIALGEKKSEAVLGVVRGGYVGTLVIDEKCAEKIFTCIEK